MRKQVASHSVSPLAHYMACLVVGIVLLLPFHAVFTTWLGSTFGYLDEFRLWKELLCIPLSLAGLLLLRRDRAARQALVRYKLVWLVLCYCALTLLLGLVAWRAHRVNTPAVLFALIANLRFVVFMILCWLAARNVPWLRRHWRPLVLAPAVLVVVFGLLQWLVLPPDVLRHLGYGPETIPAVQTVDQQAEYRRIQSTLRGANPLGAYMVVIVTALGALVVQKRRAWMAVFLGASALVLGLSFSRSAYLGALVSLALAAWFGLQSGVWRRRIALAGLAVALLGTGGVVLLRDNDTVQNVVFHSSEASTSVQSSNAGRAAALEAGTQDVLREPWGGGPGTAGPASYRNNRPPRIAENYYLQLGQEVGVLGLALFAAISLFVVVGLWRRRADTLALVVLASLAGITLVNMLSHAWTDDTLSMLWWGLAGIALAGSPSAILNKVQTNAKAHGKTKRSKKLAA